MIYFPPFLMATGACMVGAHWNGFFVENRDPDLPNYVRKRNEAFFVGGTIVIAVTAVWLIAVLLVRAL